MVRVQPLLDIMDEMTSVQQSFEAQWSEGNFPGWPVRSQPKRLLFPNQILPNLTGRRHIPSPCGIVNLDVI